MGVNELKGNVTLRILNAQRCKILYSRTLAQTIIHTIVLSIVMSNVLDYYLLYYFYCIKIQYSRTLTLYHCTDYYIYLFCQMVWLNVLDYYLLYYFLLSLHRWRFKMGQTSYGGLPFNSFIGNVAFKQINRTLKSVRI